MKTELSNRTGATGVPSEKPPLQSHSNYRYLDKNLTEQLDHVM